MIDHENVQHIASRYRAPLIKTPLTDVMLRLRNFQYRKDCASYELMYIDCMEAYGYHHGKEKCRLILEDMYECLFKQKRIRRAFLMHEERNRQFKNGERDEHFPPAPPLDVY